MKELVENIEKQISTDKEVISVLPRNGIKAIKGTLRENGKLIIVLDDDDIKQMVYAKEHGEDYIEILINKLDKMLVSLEK